MPEVPESSAESPRSPQEKLARRTKELEVLQRAAENLSSTLDLNEIYASALRTMGELFEFHHSIILVAEPGGETLRVVASRGYDDQSVGGRVKVGAGVIGLVAERRKALYAGNLGQQRAYAAAQRRQMVEAGRGQELGEATVPGLADAESQFAVPLLARDELIGVFSIESPVKRTFSPHERGLVSIVANQIAIAIHNARLFEERAQAAIALQAANASLEVRVAERTAALERELRVAEELLSDARSRVEGPLLGDSGAVRVLREAIAREAPRQEPLLLVGPAGRRQGGRGARRARGIPTDGCVHLRQLSGGAHGLSLRGARVVHCRRRTGLPGRSALSGVQVRACRRWNAVSGRRARAAGRVLPDAGSDPAR